jgi:DNA recombination protein RmuC
MAENAEKIGEAGKELYDRLAKFIEHFSRVGEGLGRAVKAYEGALGSYESRIQPQARRLAEQAAILGKELPDVPHVDGPTRLIAPPTDAPETQSPGKPGG